jgi:predicted MFS family arabinose efflux permease
MFKLFRNPVTLITTLMAAGVLCITMGVRQSMGLYVGPLNTATGLGIAKISLALAIGQFAWGLVQPLAGALADKKGPRVVLMCAILMLSLGCAITPFVESEGALIVSLGMLAAMGSGAASFSVLIGATAQKIPASDRGTASGLINAGGSLGQFIFAPLNQKLIELLGWMGSMGSMALISLLALPMIAKLTQGAPQTSAAPTSGPAHENKAPTQSVGQAVRDALSNKSYQLLHLGFFTCGFHIAFLVTHLPNEVNLCGLSSSVASWSLGIIGLANIVGSIVAGGCVNNYKSKYILALMYGSRAVLIALYLLAPKSAITFYLFAAGLGVTWLATVPPTATIVAKLFGVRYLGTLFGLTLLSHQMGGFLGAYLGGLAYTQNGDYQWMWYADMALAAFAALINLPIVEPTPEPQAQAQ